MIFPNNEHLACEGGKAALAGTRLPLMELLSDLFSAALPLHRKLAPLPASHTQFKHIPYRRRRRHGYLFRHSSFGTDVPWCGSRISPSFKRTWSRGNGFIRSQLELLLVQRQRDCRMSLKAFSSLLQGDWYPAAGMAINSLYFYYSFIHFFTYFVSVCVQEEPAEHFNELQRSFISIA